MKLLVTGRNGQVGWELTRALQPLGEVVALDRAQADLAVPNSLRDRVLRERPAVIVNAAAYTAVDKAESEPDLAMRINGEAPAALARAARDTGALLIHYSTDYVFDGSKEGPYLEDDLPNPISEYGRSKLGGERAIAESGCRYVILRTQWVFGSHGGNFLRTILRLAGGRECLRIVADQFGAPTSARLIADVTAQMLGRLAADVVAAGRRVSLGGSRTRELVRLREFHRRNGAHAAEAGRGAEAASRSSRSQRRTIRCRRAVRRIRLRLRQAGTQPSV